MWLSLYKERLTGFDSIYAKFVETKGIKRLPRTEKGVYIVMFRELNKEKGTLIYNYMYYPEFFFESIYSYFVCRNWNKYITQEWGYYLPIISTDLFKK